MSESDNKPWERPWTTQEMIDNASNWNLAGDSGLLNHLEAFSERMFSQVKDTNDRLNDLIDTADATNLALQNAINKFMGLRNTQFIESRVYEEDETLPTKQIAEKEENPKPTEAERLEEMKKAICNGLEIIDKYYEKVEIPESDSEDDTDGPNILYRPIDPYIDRPLPYVIGTSEWHKYWHVGLEHSSSDSEVENEKDQFSETESEPEIKNLPERDRTQIPGISDSESEDIPKNKTSKPFANSTFNDNTNTNRNMFDSSSDSETGSLPPQVNTVNSNFAEELAAKLGQVKSDIQPEINTKPIKKQPTTISGGLFSDEPPPLDNDDMFVKKNLNSGLFAGGDNLFDDVDDDSDFWKVPTIKSTISTITKRKDDLFAEEEERNNEIFSEKKSEKPLETEQQKKPSGLFDEDDDELFSTSIIQPKKPFLTPFKTTAPLVSEEPPEIDPRATRSEDPPEVKKKPEIEKKKPVGGVNVLGAALQHHIRKTRPPSSSESEYDSEPSKSQFIRPEPIKPKEPLKTEEPRKKEEALKKEPTKKEAPLFETSKKEISSIFDDNSPLFSDDLFNTSSTKKFTSNLFDPEPINDDDLFKVEDKKEDTSSKLFEEKKQEPEKIIENPILFIDEPPPISKKTSLFDNDDEDLFSAKPKPETKSDNSKLFSKTTGSIFDDLGDDLFNSKPNVPSTSNINLFDPNPPEIDDSDNKSESQMSIENEPSSYGSGNIGRASLFDTEPPMLSNESSGIVRDQSNSRFEEDSSFYPYLTSSRRHSDLFQDQSDSLLTTKNKILGGDSIQNLDKIPESESVTKIDITPSGNESSLMKNTENSVVQTASRIIFDDTDLFTEKKAEKPNTKPISLFDDAQPDDIFKKPEPVQQKPDNNSFKESHKSSKKKNTLFNHSESEDDELFTNKSSGFKNSDVLNNSSKPTKTLKNKNIFEDELFVPNTDGIPDVDIFKNKNLENSSSDEFNTKSDKNGDMFEQIEESNKSDETEKFNYEENLKSDEVKTDPKKSLSFEKNVEPEKMEEKIEEKEEADGQILSAGSSPGKLRHSLNINVAALLPGASPRKQNLEKSTSLDSSDNNQNIAPFEEKTKSAEKISEPKTGIEKSISFDQPINTGEILASANKERVKIPIKRRPSSRRARQEAIRKSAVDLNFEDAITENDKNVNGTPPNRIETQNILNIANNNVTESQKDEEKIKNPLLNPLSPSTDEEDFLSMPRDEDLSSENFNDSLFGKPPIISPVDLSEDNKRNIKTDLFDIVSSKEENKTKTQDLFADSDDIFSNKKPSQPKKVDSSIFSSSDSENDLFSTPKTELKKPDNNNLIASPDEDLFKPVVSSQATKPKSKLLTREDSLFEEEDIFSSKKIPPKSTIIKRSLFDEDDDDDGDDIFGSSAASTAKPVQWQSQSTSMKKAPAPSRVKKLSSDAVQDLDDPLEALKK